CKPETREVRRRKALSKLISNQNVADTWKADGGNIRPCSLKLEEAFRRSRKVTCHALHQHIAVVSPTCIFSDEDLKSHVSIFASPPNIIFGLDVPSSADPYVDRQRTR